MTRLIRDPPDCTPDDADEEVPLARAELFRRLPPERLERLMPVLRERRLARGRTVFREGQAAEFLWVLRSGKVRLIKTSPNGRVTTLETIVARQVFGALDVGDVYPASAEVIEGGRSASVPNAPTSQNTKNSRASRVPRARACPIASRASPSSPDLCSAQATRSYP